jgi:large subunit ribosomal protein L14e
LVDGPCSNVRRQALSFTKLCLTDFKVSISRSAREKQLRKAYNAAEINHKWEQTAWCRRISQKARRKELTDFDRFKLRVLRQQVM